MLNNKGFDQWSGSYDEEIANSVGYPFEGYYEILSEIQNRIEITETTMILDLGVGTGLLSQVLYEKGAQIIGLDFSEKMIEEAQKKMPKAEFMKHDLTLGLPDALKPGTFDYIVSSYAFHHFDDDHKEKLIRNLECYLKPGASMIIGDVAFEQSIDMNTVKFFSDDWDTDEFYMIGEEMIKRLEDMDRSVKYLQKSICGGILEIK